MKNFERSIAVTQPLKTEENTVKGILHYEMRETAANGCRIAVRLDMGEKQTERQLEVRVFSVEETEQFFAFIVRHSVTPYALLDVFSDWAREIDTDI